MNLYIFSIGFVILIITATDLINTSLSVRGAGFITRRLSKAIWKLLLRLNKNRGNRKILEKGGSIILVSILINWLILIWFSASLLFISQVDSLKNVETNTSTTVVSKIFYTGYTLSTLGLGDIEPDGAFWEILTSILSFTGLILISIAITYLIPVVSAEIEKRKVSVYITTLGCSVEEILLNHWNGKDFKQLEHSFANLTTMIILHAQNHKVYSVLHFFHTSNKKEAFVLNLTNLDETLTVLLHDVPAENRPSQHILMGLRKAISSYLETLPVAFISPSDITPPLVSLNDLIKAGIPLNEGEEVAIEYRKVISRRRLLLALVNDDGWKWEDIYAGAYNHEIVF